MRYAIVIEKGDTSYGAYVPDLPGCVAVGVSEEEVRQLIQDAIAFHIEGMLESGEVIPTPHSQVDYVQVKIAA
ncbi:MAG: type II toxin-antitoxin system HicB family antitoxin [Rhodothermales bacterium]|nr:type II toxin-antitoxin system HicB family antitoxin [Rhodothermales bacterium]